MLSNLYRGVVNLQVGENHPSFLNRIMEAKPRRTKIGQHTVIAPEQEILSKEGGTVAA